MKCVIAILNFSSISQFPRLLIYLTDSKEQDSINMDIENVELMHGCCLQHSCMRIEELNKTKKRMKIGNGEEK